MQKFRMNDTDNHTLCQRSNLGERWHVLALNEEAGVVTNDEPLNINRHLELLIWLL